MARGLGPASDDSGRTRSPLVQTRSSSHVRGGETRRRGASGHPRDRAQETRPVSNAERDEGQPPRLHRRLAGVAQRRDAGGRPCGLAASSALGGHERCRAKPLSRRGRLQSRRLEGQRKRRTTTTVRLSYGAESARFGATGTEGNVPLSADRGSDSSRRNPDLARPRGERSAGSLSRFEEEHSHSRRPARRADPVARMA